jgi:hypothetical protein
MSASELLTNGRLRSTAQLLIAVLILVNDKGPYRVRWNTGVLPLSTGADRALAHEILARDNL